MVVAFKHIMPKISYAQSKDIYLLQNFMCEYANRLRGP